MRGANTSAPGGGRAPHCQIRALVARCRRAGLYILHGVYHSPGDYPSSVRQRFGILVSLLWLGYVTLLSCVTFPSLCRDQQVLSRVLLILRQSLAPSPIRFPSNRCGDRRIRSLRRGELSGVRHCLRIRIPPLGVIFHCVPFLRRRPSEDHPPCIASPDF